MNHHTTAGFWACYERLPEAVQRLADTKYDVLRTVQKEHGTGGSTPYLGGNGVSALQLVRPIASVLAPSGLRNLGDRQVL
jgi:hypothetical protein